MDFNSYYMQMAEVAKLRSGCLRRQVGAVFVYDKRLIGIGYNQSPSGIDHCNINGCSIEDGHCIRTIHAEMNGILNATRAGQSLKDSVIYTTSFPCLRCLMSLRNAGIVKIVYKETYEYSGVEETLFKELKPLFDWEQV